MGLKLIVVPEFPVGSLPHILFAAVIIAGIGVTRFRRAAWSHPASVFERAVRTVNSERSGAIPRAIAMLSNTHRFPAREATLSSGELRMMGLTI
ncbi:MAG: hypothetical protein HYW93_02800 [Thaumarchaeota archaeon]|nr:hypothetical protein [Nitrososphaerota archaeon]